MNLTVAECIKHFDTALHLQSSKKEDIRAHAWAVRSAGVAVCYTDPFWTPVVTGELQGSDIRIGTAISFSYGCAPTNMKFAEIEGGLRLGATVVDMVANIGWLREGDGGLMRHKVGGLVERTRGTILPRATFEVCFLTDEEIARFTRICGDAGVDYVKTVTGSQGFPTEVQMQVVRDNITNGNTKLKVSGVPRVFTMPATLWMTEQLGVSLIGTWLVVSFVQQYAAHLGTN